MDDINLYNGGVEMSDSIMVTTFKVGWNNTFKGNEACTGKGIEFDIGMIESIIHVDNLWEVKFKEVIITPTPPPKIY